MRDLEGRRQVTNSQLDKTKKIQEIKERLFIFKWELFWTSFKYGNNSRPTQLELKHFSMLPHLEKWCALVWGWYRLISEPMISAAVG